MLAAFYYLWTFTGMWYSWEKKNTLHLKGSGRGDSSQNKLITPLEKQIILILVACNHSLRNYYRYCGTFLKCL